MTVQNLREKGIFKPSKTEDNAIGFLNMLSFKSIKSIGISTAGYFEGYFAELGKNVVATTLDVAGMKYTQELIGKYENIHFRIEDVRQKMPEKDYTYDILYSRLCLHYLSNSELEIALAECFRVLKLGGTFIAVVKSLNDWTAKIPGTYYEEETGYTYSDSKSFKRLHSVESITEAFKKAGFEIQSFHEIQEIVYEDYERTIINTVESSLIEIYAIKQ